MNEKQFIDAIIGLYQNWGEIIEAYKQAKEVEKEANCLFPPDELDNLFHDALDMEKVKEGLYVILNLKNEKGNDLFPHQKLWYVVNKVFMEMDWLIKKNATFFRQWAESVYGKQGHSTKEDWDKVKSYYKKTPSKQWRIDYEFDRPYIELARAMWQKFQGTDGKNEKLFMKENRYIWHPNPLR